MAPEMEKPTELPSWSRLVAGVGGFIGAFSILWALYGRPEYGDLTARLGYFMNSFYHDRVRFRVSVLLDDADVIRRCSSRSSRTCVYFQSSRSCS